jgi:hypothetical protein
MALPQYSTTELIANIKRRCSVPTSQLTYTDTDFTLLANDELQGIIVPMIMSTREEYFLDYEDTTIPSTGIIAFPTKSIGCKLRSVSIVRNTNPLHLESLPRIDLDVVSGIGTATQMVGFYIEDNSIKLYPTNNSLAGMTLRVYFFRRSLQLAVPLTYGKILTIDSNTNTITVSRLPSTWAADTQLNAVSSQPNFTITNSLMTIVSLSSPSIVLDSVEGLSVGDWISEYGYSAVPQIPLEAHAYLAQLTAAKALEGLGDRDGMKTAMEKAEELKKGIMTVTSQRVDGSVKKVINPSGGLRVGTGFRRNLR